LIQRQLINPDVAARLWAESLGITYVNPLESVLDGSATDTVRRSDLQRLSFVPLYTLGGAVTVAMSRAADMEARIEVEKCLGKPISPVFALPEEIKAAIVLAHCGYDDIEQQAVLFDRTIWRAVHFARKAPAGVLPQADLERWLNQLAALLLRCDAEALHFSCGRERARLRLRLGHGLYPLIEYSQLLHAALMEHFDQHVLKALDLTERATLFETEPADFELVRHDASGQVCATLMLKRRKLAQAGGLYLKSRRRASYSSELSRQLGTALNKPSGTVLFAVKRSAQLGSALACLGDHLDLWRRNTVYIGEPCGNLPEGAHCITPEKGRRATPAKAIETALLLDADCLIVEPTQDAKSLRALLHASISGRLVIVLGIASDARSALLQLLQLSDAPAMLAQALQLVVAQTTVPRLHAEYREAYRVTEQKLGRLFLDADAVAAPDFYRPAGARGRSWEAYDGTVQLHDLLVVTQPLRASIAAGPSQEAFWQALPLSCHRTARFDGLVKAVCGLVWLEDVERATAVDCSLC
jgi:type II secretory ATPase GspE/PulE/Tfp pilus assembly ATPase PilB-like protein